MSPRPHPRRPFSLMVLPLLVVVAPPRLPVWASRGVGGGGRAGRIRGWAWSQQQHHHQHQGPTAARASPVGRGFGRRVAACV